VGVRRLHAGSVLSNVLIERDALGDAEQELDRVSAGLASNSVEGLRALSRAAGCASLMANSRTGYAACWTQNAAGSEPGLCCSARRLGARKRRLPTPESATPGNQARPVAGEQVVARAAFGRP
jgi:hypothetical protein